jgi:hypothetical protein
MVRPESGKIPRSPQLFDRLNRGTFSEGFPGVLLIVFLLDRRFSCLKTLLWHRILRLFGVGP